MRVITKPGVKIYNDKICKEVGRMITICSLNYDYLIAFSIQIGPRALLRKVFSRKTIEAGIVADTPNRNGAMVHINMFSRAKQASVSW